MSRLNKFEYSDFIAYLNQKGIKYKESSYVDIDVWFTEVVEVIPDSKKLKPRYFDEDGGVQLF